MEEFCKLISKLGVTANMAEAQGLFRRFGYESVMPFNKWANILINQPSRQLADETAGGCYGMPAQHVTGCYGMPAQHVSAHACLGPNGLGSRTQAGARLQMLGISIQCLPVWQPRCSLAAAPEPTGAGFC